VIWGNSDQQLGATQAERRTEATQIKQGATLLEERRGQPLRRDLRQLKEATERGILIVNIYIRRYVINKVNWNTHFMYCALYINKQSQGYLKIIWATCHQVIRATTDLNIKRQISYPITSKFLRFYSAWNSFK
jgi:hypothetical protein